MDETESADRTGRRGQRASMAWTDGTGPPVSPEYRDRVVAQARLARPVPMVWTDEGVALDRAERRARLGMPDRPGPLVRRVNGARRASRVLRAILARLVRRANL